MSVSRHGGGWYRVLLAGVYALVLTTHGTGFAEEPAPASPRSEVPKTVLSW